MTVGDLGEVGGEGYVGVGFEISRQLVVKPGWMGQLWTRTLNGQGTR